MNTEFDVLIFGSHPDDVELGCGGTVAKMVAGGARVAIVDLTRGELGTRGSAELRSEESTKAAEILGVETRINLGLKDGLFQINDDSLLSVVKLLRKHRPRIVLANALHDRHPDHGKGADLVSQACFLAGLIKIDPDSGLKPHRPDAVYHYIQDYERIADVVIDTSDFVETKMKAILAYKSQFYDPNSEEPDTPISTQAFLDHVKGRDLAMGRPCGFDAGEGFEIMRPVGVNSLLDLL
ncbi:MAG: bacillithiol biosynthesis deacetylase BshB1 [Crocinitomicaceae bacterium]|nr:bacillithiol biosynthesis deacetylase BshB1 [Crocinitomicaceae bacterium]|tara:strand:+ start:1081 stop:1794 length:714 start_codon:yes stop_codon:yes gene_type:complete